ncbi:hypothetical protein [Fimbriiglobus ruber]|uniref:Putative zinc-binding protein n=1 Tax=Fimbriiglobus ruber TaxID=1908690 RepID=A0A225DWW6_9BACT|nr:hypothetical protein [Fimbriiglobus ruber]OWK42978.1 putative zinc-binding protein [Fimbriiglobus ruber]
MQFIVPDVLSAARGLSFGATGFLALVGLLLWAVGWRWHRFWVVFGITLSAGVLGLGAGQAAGGQVMVVGVLVAVSAGMLALELAKVLSFATGGTAAWVAAQAVLPQAHELWAVFMAGGLIGVVLYRLWTMLCTSFVGVVVAWHALITAVDQLAPFNAPTWVGDHAAALNGGVVAVTLLGVLVQVKTSPPAEGTAGTAEDDHHDHDEHHGHDDHDSHDDHGHDHHDKHHHDDHGHDGHGKSHKQVKGSWLGRMVHGRKAA